MLLVRLLLTEFRAAEKNFYRDDRVAHLPLLGSPIPMAIILTIYLLFVKVWGPKYLMKDRKPSNVKFLMQSYNLMQIALNIYVFYSSLRYSYYQSYFKFSCQEYNTQDTRASIMALRYSAYAYYISKYLDLFDTIFFVLRKKYNQISFLHVYHHSIMIFGVWAYCTLLFASHYTITGVINAFIHVCMYSYYFVAALNLDIDLMPWKRWLTRLQIIQFFYLTVHFVRPIFNNWCGLDMFWCWVAFLQNLFMLTLFSDFYIRTYLKKPKNKALTSSSPSTTSSSSLPSASKHYSVLHNKKIESTVMSNCFENKVK